MGLGGELPRHKRYRIYGARHFRLEMQITFIQIIVWLIVGALAGSLVGRVVKRSREGFGRWTNLGVGLIGAAVGGFLFDLFGIDLGLGELAISFEDLVAAFVGSLIFLAAVQIVSKQVEKRKGGKSVPPLQGS